MTSPPEVIVRETNDEMIKDETTIARGIYRRSEYLREKTNRREEGQVIGMPMEWKVPLKIRKDHGRRPGAEFGGDQKYFSRPNFRKNFHFQGKNFL